MSQTIELPDPLFREISGYAMGYTSSPVQVIEQAWEEYRNRHPMPVVAVVADTAASEKPRGTIPSSTRFDNAPWLPISRKYVKPSMDHDMAKIRQAISTGWSEEVSTKLRDL